MATKSKVTSSNLNNVTNADEAYVETLRMVLQRGQELKASSETRSTGAGKTTKEVMNSNLHIENPIQRLVFNPARKVNLPAAVARFVWMMAGSDRLADIAFYEPKVRFFSDDGISVPGSNYGERMLQPRPGLNQLAAVIERLKKDSASRRAAIAIYHPEDAVRESRDVPCTFGIFYHIRSGGLYSTTVMRSNNAFLLLPYNIFEFSLLAEAVARELKIEFGGLTHQAVSMHIYENDFEKAQEVISAWDSAQSDSDRSVPAMPEDPGPLSQIRELVILEAQLRHGSAAVSSANIEEWIKRGSDSIAEYWNQYYLLLLTHVARANKDGVALAAIESYLEEPWRSYLPDDTFDISAPRSMNVGNLLDFSARAESVKYVPVASSAVGRSLDLRVQDWERQAQVDLSWRQYAALQRHFGSKIAARDGEEISQEEFNEALGKIKEEEEPRSD